MAPEVARLMAKELGRDTAWAAAEVATFTDLAQQYTLARIAPGNPPEITKD